jgi:hypothetical protein
MLAQRVEAQGFSMKQYWLWLAPIALSACIDMSPAGPRLPSTHRFKLTIVSAELNDTRPDGSAWHTTTPSNDLGPLVGIALWSLGVPSEAAMMASNAFKNPPEVVPPSPKVSISIGAENHQTPALYFSFNPRWEYQLAIDTAGRGRDTPVQLLLRDQNGGAIIGEFNYTLDQLLSKEEHNLSNESIRSLLLKLEPLPNEPEHKIYQTNIAGSAPDWEDIRVLNGDTVRITANGSVCPSSWNRDTCGGPEGFSEDWLNYNREGFYSFPHASLIAMLSGEPLFVGKKTEFIVKEPGILLLGINDNDPSNNLGQFNVTVEVNPPGFVAE